MAESHAFLFVALLISCDGVGDLDDDLFRGTGKLVIGNLDSIGNRDVDIKAAAANCEELDDLSTLANDKLIIESSTTHFDRISMILHFSIDIGIITFICDVKRKRKRIRRQLKNCFVSCMLSTYVSGGS